MSAVQVRARGRIPNASGARLNPIADRFVAIHRDQHFPDILDVALGSNTRRNGSSQHVEVGLVEARRLFTQPPGASDLRGNDQRGRSEDSDFQSSSSCSSSYRLNLTGP